MFVVLHESGRAVRINVLHIAYYFPNTNIMSGLNTQVNVRSGSDFIVSETVEQIDALIKQALVSVA